MRFAFYLRSRHSVSFYSLFTFGTVFMYRPTLKQYTLLVQTIKKNLMFFFITNFSHFSITEGKFSELIKYSDLSNKVEKKYFA